MIQKKELYTEKIREGLSNLAKIQLLALVLAPLSLTASLLLPLLEEKVAQNNVFQETKETIFSASNNWLIQQSQQYSFHRRTH